MSPTADTGDNLRSFIAHARGKGMGHETIRMLLLSAGWKERDIAQAIGAEGLDEPIPVPPDTGGARDAFFHLLVFAGLYTLVISTVVLAFTFIGWWFPDPALDRYGTLQGMRTTIRWSLAAIIVAAPFFFWISRLVLAELRRHPEKQASGIRRWLTYLTLLVASAVLVGDLITLVFQLLEGEITLRFLFKVAVVFLLAGLVFTYYSRALRRPVAEHGGLHRTFAAAAGVVLLPAFIYGVVLAGSPLAERQRKLDEQRVDDVRTIARAAMDFVYDGDHYRRKEEAEPQRDLPQTLQQLAQQSERHRVPLEDPEGEAYVYRVMDENRFEVCATFNFPREQNRWKPPFWDHPAGPHCYSFDITTPDLP
ncbi:MAG: DUF5671 domain-containing protein [Planctomycetota bacterium]|jgi:hypothetical protein